MTKSPDTAAPCDLIQRNGSLPLGPGNLREDPNWYQAVRQGHCG